MKFKLSFTWSYDPLGIISKLRVEKKITPYAYIVRPKIEQYENKKEWQENTLQEVEEQIVTQTASQTPIPQEKDTKRSRESLSPTIL